MMVKQYFKDWLNEFAPHLEEVEQEYIIEQLYEHELTTPLPSSGFVDQFELSKWKDKISGFFIDAIEELYS